MNEIIAAMQLIKMYAWEKSFAKLIGKVRKEEMDSIRGPPTSTQDYSVQG